MKKGLVHVYTGNGKGKTTAAVGLGLRAYGRGFKVLLIQFLKNENTGEIIAIEKLDQNFMYFRNKKVDGLFWKMSEDQKRELKVSEQEALSYAIKEVKGNEWDLIILDEVLGSISNACIAVKDIADLIKNKPPELEIVLTGRNVPQEIIELSDYVSEINEVKHPFSKGIPARIGIEN